VAIDGTVRQWSLRPNDLQLAIDIAKNGPPKEEEPKAESMLTEEEERELAELMGDD
jgi:hypothetical protein